LTDKPTLKRVRLNGDEISTDVPTLDALLTEAGFGNAKVATAINGTFVPARQRTTQTLADGDHIEVVAARQGG